MNKVERDWLNRVEVKLDDTRDRVIAVESTLSEHVKWHDSKWWRIGKYGFGGTALGSTVTLIIKFILDNLGGK